MARRCGASHTRWLVAAVVTVVLIWMASLAAGAWLLGFTGQGEGFNLLHWEVTRLVGFGLYRTSDLIAPRGASNAEIVRYFDLLRRARAARQQGLAAATPAAADSDYRQEQQFRSQADRLRFGVEIRFERAVGDAARHEGLVERLPVFGSVALVWPPVATSFTITPHILIISPRSKIVLQSTELLRPDLTEPEAERIERQAEQKGSVSALVDQIGGLAAFPSITDEDSSPLALMQDVAHEWTHTYLAFHPLGARYGVSGDLTVINETAANLVGRELGTEAFASLHLPPSPQNPSPPAASTGFDFDKTMHDLRLEVDRLLAQGRITEAEQRMDETQKLLAAHGYHIRRINQAYFAFYGNYGDTPAASNPLGTDVQTLRRASPSLASFLHVIQDVRTPADLQNAVRHALHAG